MDVDFGALLQISIAYLWCFKTLKAQFPNPLTPAPATEVAGEDMIGHNSWTDWAREPVKASLHAEGSKDSNEFDKRYHLFIWNLWENVIFVHLQYWFYGNFQRK